MNFSPRYHHFPQCQFRQKRDEIMLNLKHSLAIQDFPITRSVGQSSEPWSFITNPNSLHQLPTTNLHHTILSLKLSATLLPGAWYLWCNPTPTIHRKVNSIVCLFVYGFFDKTDKSWAFNLVVSIWILDCVHVPIALNKSRTEHCYKSVLLFSDIKMILWKHKKIW